MRDINQESLDLKKAMDNFGLICSKNRYTITLLNEAHAIGEKLNKRDEWEVEYRIGNIASLQKLANAYWSEPLLSDIQMAQLKKMLLMGFSDKFISGKIEEMRSKNIMQKNLGAE